MGRENGKSDEFRWVRRPLPGPRRNDCATTTWLLPTRRASASAGPSYSVTLLESMNVMFYRLWASTTRDRSKSVLKIHLNPEFGDLMLREMTLEVLQHYFARLQATKHVS